MKSRSKNTKIDRVFVGALFVLVILGLAILASASVVKSTQLNEGLYYYFFQQLTIGVLLGLLWFGVVQLIYYKYWEKFSFLVFLGAVILNCLVIVPGIGVTRMGATRWLNLGVTEFQPSDVLKLALVLYLSMLIVKNKERLKNWSFFGIYFSIIMLSVGIVFLLQSNLSTAILIYMIGLSILFLGNVPIKWLILMLGIPAFIIGGFMSLILAVDVGCRQDFLSLVGISDTSTNNQMIESSCMQGYRIRRIATFLGSSQSSEDDNYHSTQNLIAIGSGGFWGVGWGQSRQKFNYVPEAYGDSIFSIYAEEMGLFGVLFLIFLYAMLTFTSLKIAFRSTDMYARLVIGGILTWFVLQSTVNIGANIALIPLTGVPLPFVSYGKTSVWMFLIAFGIIGNISKYQKKNN